MNEILIDKILIKLFGQLNKQSIFGFIINNFLFIIINFLFFKFDK